MIRDDRRDNPRVPGLWISRILTYGLGLGGLAFVAFSVSRLDSTDRSDAYETAAREVVINIGNSIIRSVERTVRPAIERGRIFAESQDIIRALKRRDSRELTEICNVAIRASTEVDAIALFNADGEIAAINSVYADGTPVDQERIERVIRRDYSERPIITNCLNNDARAEALEFQTGCDITPAYFDSSGLSVAHSVPVIDSGGRQVGLVSTRIDFERITSLIKNHEIAGGSGKIHLVTDDGGYFDEAINSGDELPPLSRETLAAFVAPLVAGHATPMTTHRENTYYGLFRAAALETMEGGGIQVLLAVPDKWLAREARMASLLAVGAPAAFGFLMVGLAALIGAISHIIKKEKNLQYVVKELQAFFGTTPDLLCIMDDDGRFLKINYAWSTLIGTPPDEIQNRSFLELVHEEDREKTAARISMLKADGPIEPFVNRFRTQSGEIRQLEWRAGRFDRHVYAAGRDVTTRIGHERKLEALEERLRLFVEHAPAALAMFDTDMRYLVASRGWYEQYGLCDSKIIGRTHYEVFPSIPQRWMDYHARVMKGESLREERDVFQGIDGTKTWVRWELCPWYDAEGNIGGIIMATEVINDQIEFERNLNEARLQAEAANVAKGEFLANMSHEIRTPMTAILGYADLLESEGDLTPDETAMAIRTIRSNTRHLLTVINDILDMSKIEAGKMTVEHIAMDPVTTITEVASLMHAAADDKAIHLNVRLETEIPRVIESDPTRVRQILLNLVGNAVKFTESGSVEVLVAHDLPRAQLIFRVEDTGIGMTPPQRDAIARFDAFQQADGSTVRKFGGAGLGLRISNALANLLGGKIDVESEYGQGSAFTVTISTGQIESTEEAYMPALYWTSKGQSIDEGNEQAATDKSKPLQGRQILLAEDGTDNQRLINFHLDKAGAEVTIVDNGRAAIQTIGDDPDKVRFDLILMDMQMPEMDGFETVRNLRSRGFCQQIVALTAHDKETAKDKCLAAGCNAFLTKPLDGAVLIQTCCSIVNKHVGAETAARG